MILRDFIAKLQALPQEAMDLPVVVEDWNEDYAYPSEEAAERVAVMDVPTWEEGKGRRYVRRVVIGAFA